MPLGRNETKPVSFVLYYGPLKVVICLVILVYLGKTADWHCCDSNTIQYHFVFSHISLPPFITARYLRCHFTTMTANIIRNKRNEEL